MSQPCKNVCEQPQCEWRCKAPSNCPRPTCKMICETPKKCHTTSFMEKLPPLSAGQLSVASFVAPTMSVTADRNEGDASPAADSSRVDVNVRSFAAPDHIEPQQRVVSMPVLAEADGNREGKLSWVPAQAGEDVEDN